MLGVTVLVVSLVSFCGPGIGLMDVMKDDHVGYDGKSSRMARTLDLGALIRIELSIIRVAGH